MTLDEALACATLPIPVAGKVFYDLSRNGSYEAAKRGDIPTIDLGRKKRAVVAKIADQLGLRSTAEKRSAA
jgi:hypothetical protein